ncbi:MAG: ABC transporter substrate-binding protein [Deltaproteobacteria bacterium]|nr:ABC transporter substrate-binding protein [Deltaproteobacteria bacterium]
MARAGLTWGGRAASIALALLALFATFEPARAADGAASKPLTLGLNWVPEPEFGGFYAAELDKLYARNGLSVVVRPGGPGVPTVQEVALGRLEYSVAEATEVVLGRAAGLDIVGLFAVYQTTPRAIMARKEIGAGSLAELFARPVSLAVEPGSVFTKYLEHHYGASKVSIVPMAGAMERFLTEKSFAMQAFATSEPILARHRGADPQVLLLSEIGFNPYMTVVITSGQRWRTAQREARSFVAAVRDGWKSYLADPRPANERMHQLNSAMDLATFAESAKTQEPLVLGKDGLPGLGRMTLDRWKTVVDQLTDLGLVEGTKVPKPEDCFVDALPPS